MDVLLTSPHPRWDPPAIPVGSRWATSVLEVGAPESAQPLFDSYDSFLEVLSNEPEREELASLGPDADDNPLLVRCEEIAQTFQDGLATLFFETDEALTRATQRYGVF